MNEKVVNAFNYSLLRVLILICGFYAVLHFFKGYSYTPFILFGEFIIVCLIYMNRDKFTNTQLSALLSGLFLFFISNMAFFTGGSNATTIVWLIPLLIYSFIANTRKVQSYFFIATVCIFSVLFLMTQMNLLPESVLPPESKQFLTFVNFLLCLFFVQFISKKNQGLMDAQNQMLAESLERNEMIIKGVQAGVFDWMDTSTTEVYWSPMLYEIMGYKDGEIKSDTDWFMSRIHPDDLESLYETQVAQLAQGNIVKSEYRLQKKDGSYIWIHGSSYVVKYADGTPKRFIGAITDETEKVENRKQLEVEKEKAELASKAKTTFLENMTHEIRTPLNGIIGLSEVLRERITRPENVQLLNDIVQSGTQLMDIISDILDFSKIEKQKITINRTPNQLSEILTGLNSIYKGLTKKKGIEFNIRDKNIQNLWFSIDRVKLTQILNNLLSNALKFTQAGKIELTVKYDDSHLYFELSDTGTGISQSELALVFQPFHQANNQTSTKLFGTGLGLAICKRFVEKMGGEISVESELDKGTTFSFHINAPQTVEESNLALPEKLIVNTDLSESFFLIAEDNELNLKVMQNYLKSLGLEFDIARDGVQAYKCCQVKKYDFVFMDIQMPVLDGIEATKKIKKLDNPPIIIALTANAFDEAKDTALKAGMDNFMSKPVKKDDIIKMINRYSKMDIT